ncbi:hypothetical protein PN36_00060 [Candidatus Thiomargarita nelsonii]|uniref:ATP-binding protein n=1 Tax=Candidatus Thiomargarita nelsonii TaxID=1003181 RepID=A0A0A6P4S2_9GAMM|nr:hypothetical protein PN36_00060 [Candidatus Thiomargarita nelsonii]
MVQVFGEFHNESHKSREFLKLGFSPGSAPLQQRWRNNGLSADFLADYLTTFFPSEESEPNALKKQAKIKEAVSYIANELLENAMKFNDDTSNYQVTLQFQLYSDHLILRVTNSIHQKNVNSFQVFIKELLTTEPQELYLRQMKRAEEDENMTTSRLGFLTMIDGYNAKLGWQFETSQQNPKVTLVTTMAQLSL